MKFFPKALSYLLSVHLLALVFLSLFRLVFYFSVKSSIPTEYLQQSLPVAKSFLMGLWFDNVIACYIMALPLLGVGLAGIFHYGRAWIFRALNIWFCVFYTLVFMACAGNIPYFAYFSKLLNASIWNWAEYGTTTLGMIFGEASYYAYIAAFFISATTFATLLYLLRTRVFRLTRQGLALLMRPRPTWIQRTGYFVVFALLGGACFLGIRGRLGYNPIKVSAAYHSTNTVLNNSGVNPMFNLLTSTLDNLRPENQQLHLMDAQQAIARSQQLLGRTGITGISPIARQVRPEGEPTRQNVVLVLMESLSAKLMTRFGNPKQLTPALDSLYQHSLSFSNCYSAGNHTNHGLYATLYSFPSILFRNAMKGTVIPTYSGLPTVLREQGYSTLFFMTHESQYDNMNAFFRTNGYEEIYAQENYPKKEVVNHFGVPDAYLFEYALPVLNRHAASGKPFFATLLTISNHPPYVVPKKYQDENLLPEEQIVRYADDCIRQFMSEVRRQPWAKNTLFVFLGDHGKLVGTADCELPESFNHIPLFFHADGLTPREVNHFAGQVDVAPTILGLLRIPYTQNNFGIDLLKERRPAAFYTADKTIAARDSSHLYVYNAETTQEYCYQLDKETSPRQVPFTPCFKQLKQYVFPLLQTAEQLVQEGLTVDHPQTQQ